MTVYDIIKELGINIGWSPLYGECIITLNEELDAIIIDNGCNRTMLGADGKFDVDGEVMIFPAKDNRDWGLLKTK